MWSTFIKALAKLGSKAVKFAIKHKNAILKVLKEIGIQAAIELVKKQLGL